jgi:AcrR family transcriptional regulator
VAAKTVDRRVQKTHQLLQSALMALIHEKGFEALSVQDIIDRANVGRATFYAHFDNKEDLLVSRLDDFRTTLLRQQKQAHAEVARANDRMFAYGRALFIHVDEHRTVFRAMVGKRSGAVIQHLFHKMLVDLVREDLRAVATPNTAGAAPREAVVHLIAGGLFGLVLWWVDGPLKLSVEDVDTLFRRLAASAVSAMRPDRSTYECGRQQEPP